MGCPFVTCSALYSQESVEEVAIALQRDAKVFSGRFLAARPLIFQPGPSLREARRQLFDRRRHQSVGTLHAFARVIDEACLHVVPPVAEVSEIVFAEKSIRKV